MDYGNLKGSIRNHLNNAAEDFFMVGYCLRQISEHALFEEDGYKSIWDFAKGEYGLSASSASRFMAINARFSIDDGEHMAEKYIGMGVSKLQEMLGLPDEELEKVTQETTVREIRAMKKNQEKQKSFFGLPKTDEGKHPYTYMPGCGDGKYTCFSCARPCGIRQEERHCRTATCENPFPCTQMGEEKRLDIEAGLFSEKCQHLHPELAPVREGDKEPAPCCLTCEHKACFSRCDVAKERDEDERKKERKELEKQEREKEAQKPDITKRHMKSFYDYAEINMNDKITGARLKEEYGKSYSGFTCGDTIFQCTPRGVRSLRSREMTWGEVAKALTEIQEAEKKQDTQKKKEDGRLLKFYENIYPSTRQIIEQRDKAAITKELKIMYGSTYEDGEGWMCYPDKIVFRDSPDAEQIQITWGRFVTKLVEFLDRFPETERSILFRDANREKKPEIIDSDFRDVEDESKDDPKQEAAEAEAEPQEESESQKLEPSPEEYSRLNVADILERESFYLKSGVREGVSAKFIRNHKILVDALTLLFECMGGDGGRKQTNADRIRSMTNEELADFFCKVKADYQWSEQEFPSEDAGGDWEEWLESECDMG